MWKNCLAAALALAALPLPVAAQFGPETNSKAPINISADQSLEWHQNDKTYVARGNAVATQKDVSVSADLLTAHYRDAKTGGTEIWQLEADGNVVITSPGQTVWGSKGVYDVDTLALVVTGEGLKLETQTDIITARDSLEFWRSRNEAYAKGDAKATRKENGNILRGDLLTALFVPGPDNKLDLRHIKADGHVIVTTATDVAFGRAGEYDLGSEIATLNGDVRITRGQNQLNGDAAEVNMKTGISKIVSTAPGKGPAGRVSGMFIPGQQPGASVPHQDHQ